ncbi:DegV family protein [Brockia lithotrophica]|uniref:DegV family protein with EDD domain n=1 Tax=Brockia lithotrophica TaxID=933949 RepID=A0A660KUQ2_9BACL|nr:DegV family protein [Brockia lithotrophica]RKQ84713.1 DegV family protein with EDD domain [Brockia lithotrophica]
MFRILVDGTIDLPPEFLTASGFTVVPQKVVVDGRELPDVELRGEAFSEVVRKARTFPTTSSPSPYDFYRAYEELYAAAPDVGILALTVSSGVSATYEHAYLAAEEFRASHPDAQIVVVDSKTGSVGLGLLALFADELRQKGASLAEAAAELREAVKRFHLFVYIDTLENLMRSGRIDRFHGRLAGLLQIKPIFLIRDGVFDLFRRVRGRERALAAIAEEVVARIDLGKKRIGIAYADARAEAERFVARLRDRLPQVEFLLTEMGPAIALHGGPGSIVVGFFGRDVVAPPGGEG